MEKWLPKKIAEPLEKGGRGSRKGGLGSRKWWLRLSKMVAEALEATFRFVKQLSVQSA